MSNSIEEEMKKLMKPGVRVVRGRDWQWGDQDGYGPGTVMSKSTFDHWFKVKWDNRDEFYESYYRMGAEGKYDLKIIDYMQQPTEKSLGVEKSLGSMILNARKFFDFCEEGTQN